MSKVSRETAEKAASWWAEKVVNPGFQNNGADDSANQMAQLLGTMLAMKNSASSEQADKFKKSLTDIILREDVHFLGVDYGPDCCLREAADVAGINPSVFPWKTTMRIDNDMILVSQGYGAAYVEI